MSYREIAEEYNVSVSALKRHRLNHMPLYVRVSARVRTIEDEEGEAVRAISAVVGGKRTVLRLEPYMREVGKRFRVCEGPEQIRRGKAHAAKARAHYEKLGEPDRWDELVSLAQQALPGFRVVK